MTPDRIRPGSARGRDEHGEQTDLPDDEEVIADDLEVPRSHRGSRMSLMSKTPPT